MDALTKTHAAEVKALQTKHQSDLKDRDEDQAHKDAEYEKALADLQKVHRDQVSRLQDEHHTQVRKIEDENTALV